MKKGDRVQRSGLRKVSLIWKHMLMMMCILLLALSALIISNHQSLKTLTEEHLEKYQLSLDRDCAKLNDAMHMTIAIPDGVEGTRYYDYIKSITSGELDTRYYPVLNYIRKALNNQIYLQGTNEVTLLYLIGCNSIVTNKSNIPVAEDCFNKNIKFTETGVETIMGYLKDRNTIKLLPMQQVKIHTATYQPCMALIIHPNSTNTSVMTLYSESTILESLGVSYLPEGTHLKLTAEDGQILYQYPQAITEDISDSCYLLTGELKDLKVTAQLWIPKAYFAKLLRPVRSTGIGSILLVALIGITMSIVLSIESVRPIRQLISTHAENQTQDVPNEIAHLDSLLSSSRQKSENLQEQLFRQILARALSGNILTEQEERYLEQTLVNISGSCQAAILHTSPDINLILGEHLQKSLDGSFFVILNDKETGMLFPAGEPFISKLGEEIQLLNAQLLDRGIHCGISAPVSRLHSLHIAVRQARAALPQEIGIKLFAGNTSGSSSVSWLQHERLYQSIASNDEEETLRLLNSIADRTNHSNAREAFYNVRFVLHSAAEEIGVKIDAELGAEYVPNLLPRENIRNLSELVRRLFSQIRAKNLEQANDSKTMMLDYIHQNMADYELCAASVAEQFQVPEKKVYEAVRSKTGMTFKEYLTSLRMKKAAELLYTTREGIAEIAQQCGYQGSSTFYRLFQEYHGMTPGQYRRAEKPDTAD